MSIPTDAEFTELIYNQYKADNFVPLKVMEEQRNFDIKVKNVYPGTEANPGIVYGYGCNQELLRNGGIKKSYNKEFKSFGLNYNGAKQSEMVILNPERLHENYKTIVSYFHQRGYPMQQSDQPKAYNGIYLCFFPSLAPVVYINGLQFVYCEKKKCEKKCGKKTRKLVAVDFWLNYGYGYFDPTIELYNQTSNFKSNGLYPIRIPVTTKQHKFEQYANIKPMVYYDKVNSLLTVKIPEVDSEGIMNMYTIDQFGTINFNVKQYVLAFDATYKILKRNRKNKLVSSTLDDFTCLAQTNPILNMKFRILSFGDALPPISPGENVVPLQIPLYYGPGLTVNSPANIVGEYAVGNADFGAKIYNVTADLAFTTNLDGTPLNPGDFVGKIALIPRGVESFALKATNAQAAGAVGCVIINNIPGAPPNDMTGNAPNVTIPVVSVSFEDGTSFVENLPVNVTLNSATKKNYGGNLLVHNGGDNFRFNLNAFPGAVDSNVPPLNPLNSGIAPTGTCRFGSGDNPATKLIEGWYQLAASNAYDNAEWEKETLQCPIDMINGKYYPEQAPIAQVPVLPNKDLVTLLVQAHESVHESARSSGGVYLMPTEAMATALELDTSFTFGTFQVFRASDWYPMIASMTRGFFFPMLADNSLNTPAPTYGASYFWRYLYEQFDPNQQVIRRCNDIAGSYPTFDLYNQNIVRGYRSNTIPSNNILQQALSELYDKDVKEVWNDSCIAQVLFRNNTSIPSKYRIQYPFWMYNSQYSGYPQILQAAISAGIPQFANFWELMQNNAVIQPNQIRGPMDPSMIGETFIQTLPNSTMIFTLDMSNYSYFVPHETTNIQISVNFGEWKFSLLQFTSDGTEAGQFIIDGPHSVNVADGEDPIEINFDVASHVPAFTPTGNIYLVCTCVTLFNQPGLYVYLGDFTLGGWISINSNLDPAKLANPEKKVKLALPSLDQLPADAKVAPFLRQTHKVAKKEDRCPLL